MKVCISYSGEDVIKNANEIIKSGKSETLIFILSRRNMVQFLKEEKVQY